MSRSIFLSLATLILVISKSLGQENLHFSVDRPVIADLPTTVPVCSLQIESGLEYYKRENFETYFLPTMLLRTGITKDIEARVTTRYLRVDSSNDAHGTKSDVGFSADIKAKFIHEKGFLPSAAIVGGYNFASVVTPQLRHPLEGFYSFLLMEDNLHDKVIFNYNVGIIWGGTATPTTMYAFCFEIELHQNASVFIEQSSFYNSGEKDDHWLNFGYTHLVAKHSQMDFSVGRNFNGGDAEYFIALGYSTRLSFKGTPK